MGSTTENIGNNWREAGEKLVGTRKGRLTAVHEVVEEKEKKIKEWNEEDEMGNMEDTTNEL